VRLADAFRDVGVPQVGDGDFLLTCTCGLTQRLDATQIDEEDDLTLYDCARCANSLVGVMPDDATTALWVSSSSMTRRQEVGGHRRRGVLIGSKVDVALRPPDARDDVLLIPATPSFFAALRNL
jgi:hypothetical protein